MNCLRCGRETQEDHVFCDRCREEMDKCPIRPGTPILLPTRREEAAPRKSKRHTRAVLTQEEQIRRLKRQRFWILLISICVTALLVTALTATGRALQKNKLRPGQNYSSMETTAPETKP